MVKTNSAQEKKKFSHPLSTKYTIQITSIHTPFTLHYIAMNCKNEISFICKPLKTQKLFLVILMYQLPEDDPFGTKPVLYKSPIYVINDPLL